MNIVEVDFECNAVEYIVVATEHTAFDYTTVAVEKNVAASGKIATAVEKSLMVTAATSSLSIGVLLPSCNTCSLSIFRASHILDNPCLHDPQSDKM